MLSRSRKPNSFIPSVLRSYANLSLNLSGYFVFACSRSQICGGDYCLEQLLMFNENVFIIIQYSALYAFVNNPFYYCSYSPLDQNYPYTCVSNFL